MPTQNALALDSNALVFRGRYSGTGGELFGQLIVGALLTAVTFGIYLPWFVVRLHHYVVSKTTLGDDRLRFEFDGTGGELFGLFILGGLLTAITFGIYGAWWMVNLTRFFADHTWAITRDGRRYQMRFDGQGGELLGTWLIGLILTAITFGIYTPWFACQMQKYFASHTKIVSNGVVVGGDDFVGTGGDLLVEYLIGMFLTVITFGIYNSWFQVKMNRFFLQNARWSVDGRTFSGDFDGTGGELFVISLVGGLLTCITFGIYYFWLLNNMIRFNTDHVVIKPV